MSIMKNMEIIIVYFMKGDEMSFARKTNKELEEIHKTRRMICYVCKYEGEFWSIEAN